MAYKKFVRKFQILKLLKDQKNIKESDNLLLRNYWNKTVGLKDLAKPSPFHIKPKAHAEEEEMPDDEWRESRLLGYTAKDDPVLGRPKSQKGKAPHCQKQSPQGSQRRFRAQWVSHRSMVEKQPQQKLSPLY